jgi:hypothetical protein
MGEPMRFYTNWAILCSVARHPVMHWRLWRGGQKILNGYWFSYPDRLRR